MWQVPNVLILLEGSPLNSEIFYSRSIRGSQQQPKENQRCSFCKLHSKVVEKTENQISLFSKCVSSLRVYRSHEARPKGNNLHHLPWLLLDTLTDIQGSLTEYQLSNRSTTELLLHGNLKLLTFSICQGALGFS